MENTHVRFSGWYIEWKADKFPEIHVVSYARFDSFHEVNAHAHYTKVIHLKGITVFITRLIITLLAFSIVGCAPIKYLQPNSDTLPTNLLPNKATVLVEASFGSANAPVLFLTKKITANTSYDKVTAVDIVEFANYEGAVIPSYSSKEPYGVHAFHITPGQYVIMRCVYGAPEIEWCIPGAWKNNGNYVGLATFEVKSGEVVNVGNLNMTRDRQVNILNNNTEALKYLEQNRPELAPILKYRPMTFTSI